MDKIPALRTGMCSRTRKRHSDTVEKSDFNRCLLGTRRIGEMDGAIKMSGR